MIDDHINKREHPNVVSTYVYTQQRRHKQSSIEQREEALAVCHVVGGACGQAQKTKIDPSHAHEIRPSTETHITSSKANEKRSSWRAPDTFEIPLMVC